MHQYPYYNIVQNFSTTYNHYNRYQRLNTPGKFERDK